MNLSFLIDIIKRKKRAYAACFYTNISNNGGGLSEEGAIVMADIMEFCKPYATTHFTAKDGKIDPIAAAIREGQRSVYLHIMKQLSLDDAQIIEITRKLQQGEM